MFGPCFCYAVRSALFQFCNHLDGEGRAGRFFFSFVILMACDGDMGWSAVYNCDVN